MSYDLSIYLEYTTRNDLNKSIISFYKKYGLDILIHPEFEFLEQSGFLPIVFLRTSKLLMKRFEFDILTGFEFYIDEIKDEEKEEIFTEKKLIRPFSHSILLVVHDSLELLCGTMFASSLTYIFEGVLTDTYSGEMFEKKKAKRYLKTYIKTFKEDIKDINHDDVHKFEEWL